MASGLRAARDKATSRRQVPDLSVRRPGTSQSALYIGGNIPTGSALSSDVQVRPCDTSAVNMFLFMSTDVILNCLYISLGYVVDRTRDIGVQFCMKTATGFITNMLSNKQKIKQGVANQC